MQEDEDAAREVRGLSKSYRRKGQNQGVDSDHSSDIEINEKFN